MEGGLKMEDRILKALIIHHLVDDNYLNREQLSGINNVLESFSKETLEMMCKDLQIGIEEN